MNTRSIGVLALVTGATLVLATVLTRSRENATAAQTTDQALFPEFAAHINDVARLEVKSSEGTFTLEREGGAWGLVEKAGYPVDSSKVRKLLFALKDAAILEAKTSKPELYAKLGVEGSEGEDATSVELEVTDTAGKSLAGLVVGNRGAGGGSAYYVRRKDEAASFLVEADLTLDRSDKSWLAKEIVDVPRERIRAVQIEHADGERVLVRKADPTAKDFLLEDIPAGKELRYAGAPGSLASALARLTMDDVRAADEVTLPQEPLAVTTCWTHDGLKVTATLYEVEEELLASFAAEFDEASVAPAEPETDPEAEPGTESEDLAPPAPAGASPDEVRAEAEALASKTRPWIYVLPTWKKSTLAKTMEELTKDIPAPVEESEPAEDAALELLEDLQDAAGEPSGSTEDGHEGHDHGALEDDHDHGDHAGDDAHEAQADADGNRR